MSAKRTHFIGPRASVIRRFHCSCLSPMGKSWLEVCMTRLLVYGAFPVVGVQTCTPSQSPVGLTATASLWSSPWSSAKRTACGTEMEYRQRGFKAPNNAHLYMFVYVHVTGTCSFVILPPLCKGFVMDWQFVNKFYCLQKIFLGHSWTAKKSSQGNFM